MPTIFSLLFMVRLKAQAISFVVEQSSAFRQRARPAVSFLLEQGPAVRAKVRPVVSFLLELVSALRTKAQPPISFLLEQAPNKARQLIVATSTVLELGIDKICNAALSMLTYLRVSDEAQLHMTEAFYFARQQLLMIVALTACNTIFCRWLLTSLFKSWHWQPLLALARARPFAVAVLQTSIYSWASRVVSAHGQKIASRYRREAQGVWDFIQRCTGLHLLGTRLIFWARGPSKTLRIRSPKTPRERARSPS